MSKVSNYAPYLTPPPLGKFQQSWMGVNQKGKRICLNSTDQKSALTSDKNKHAYMIGVLPTVGHMDALYIYLMIKLSYTSIKYYY